MSVWLIKTVRLTLCAEALWATDAHHKTVLANCGHRIDAPLLTDLHDCQLVSYNLPVAFGLSFYSLLEPVEHNVKVPEDEPLKSRVLR